MRIEEMLPIALAKASSVRETSRSNRQMIFHVGYFAEWENGGRISVSTSQSAATDHHFAEISEDGRVDLKAAIKVSTFSDVIVSSLRFPGDRRDTYNPDESEVLDFLSNYQ